MNSRPTASFDLPSVPGDFAAVAVPGAMISNAWPDARLQEGRTLAAVEEVCARLPFFECFQSADVPSVSERRQIRALMAGRHAYTYTLTRGLAAEGLNLSSLDPQRRKQACDRVVRFLDEAQEAGATAVALISGARPESPTRRSEALRALADALFAIMPAAVARRMEIVLEPLDFEAHKRATLGTTGEAVELCGELARHGFPVRLCVDTAHVLLNGEDPIAAVAQSRAFITELHLCNAVTDVAHPLFGDRHLPFGAPGVLGAEEIGDLLAALFRSGFLARARRPRVYCEVLKPDGVGSLEVVRQGEVLLKSAWQHARYILGAPRAG